LRECSPHPDPLPKGRGEWNEKGEGDGMEKI